MGGGNGRGREEVELRRGRPSPPAADVKSSVASVWWQGFRACLVQLLAARRDARLACAGCEVFRDPRASRVVELCRYSCRAESWWGQASHHAMTSLRSLAQK